MSRKTITERFLKAQNSLVLQSADFSLETLASMVESGTIDISPGYQRRVRWDVKRQSALIESFLLNIPIPPIYLSEDDYGKYSVIDGKQRLTAIHMFMRDKFRLSMLERFRELEGYRFKMMPADLKNALSVRPYLRAITLLRQTDPSLKYEVFTRLNKQGAPLTSQEIRNVLYRGNLNDLLTELGENPFLKRQLKITSSKAPAYKKMKDIEFVLRFLSLCEVKDNFSGSYDRTMDYYMEEHRKISLVGIEDLRSKFNRAITWCESLWGKHAFKRADSVKGWRNQMLSGMYDAQMVAVNFVADACLENVNSRELVRSTKSLFLEDEKFDTAVRIGTNTPERVKYRINKVIELLKESC